MNARHVHPDDAADGARKGGMLHAVRAVAWSFLGIRRRSGLEEDVQHLKPLQVVIVGIVLALVFVAALILLVRWIVGSGVAT